MTIIIIKTIGIIIIISCNKVKKIKSRKQDTKAPRKLKPATAATVATLASVATRAAAAQTAATIATLLQCCTVTFSVVCTEMYRACTVLYWTEKHCVRCADCTFHRKCIFFTGVSFPVCLFAQCHMCTLLK